MIKIPVPYWRRLPSDTVLAALRHFTWQRIDDLSAAAGTAALMLYVALLFMAEERPNDPIVIGSVAGTSYDALGEATGLSRSLISQGLQRLQALKLITSEGSRQKRRYGIVWNGGRWSKLPCQAIVSGGAIRPFKNFTLRSKHELHAMKLYLYLAAVRPRDTVYSVASYETIFERIGIPERDIRKAISLLIGCGLLASVARDHEEGERSYGPNKYFLTGYQRF